MTTPEVIQRASQARSQPNSPPSPPDSETTSQPQQSLLPEPVTDWSQEPEPRRWLLQDWLPENEVVLLTGRGSVGKSRLLQQLASALACGPEFVNLHEGWLPAQNTNTFVPKIATDSPVKVVFAGWEDDRNEALRRRSKLGNQCKWAKEKEGLEAMTANLRYYPMRGCGPVYGVGERGHIATRGEGTLVGEELLQTCKNFGAKLLILDPLSLALLTSENDRALVSLALEYLAGWAMQARCAVILSGHPAKTTAGESSDYSGTSGWRGLVRALWTLKRVAESADETETTPDPDAHCQLRLNKSNYALEGQFVTLQTVKKGSAWIAVEDTKKKTGGKSWAEKIEGK